MKWKNKGLLVSKRTGAANQFPLLRAQRIVEKQRSLICFGATASHAAAAQRHY